MDLATVVPLLIGLAVIGVVTLVAFGLGKSPGTQAEARLDQLVGLKPARTDPEKGLLLRPDHLHLGGSRELLPSLEGLSRLYEQADVGLELKHFALIPLVLLAAGLGLGVGLGQAWPLALGGGLGLAVLPWFWLLLRKRKRIKQFVAQMPDALELVGRALRAGHSLASGLRVVADEMAPPVSQEFGRVFEEQNLGIPMEDALRGLAERIPTMDVRFFVTAVVIQRSTGGDLAEILDKIGRLIRERFQILGQVQALTAEGRLSGVVLLALPPSLLAVTYFLNPQYTSLLFTTTVGTKLLVGAAVMQALGAAMIKKIITIKV